LIIIEVMRHRPAGTYASWVKKAVSSLAANGQKIQRNRMRHPGECGAAIAGKEYSFASTLSFLCVHTPGSDLPQPTGPGNIGYSAAASFCVLSPQNYALFTFISESARYAAI